MGPASATTNDRELSQGMTAFSNMRQQPLQNTTMVLVTDQFHGELLIRQGRELADRTGTRLEVINVAAAMVERNHGALEHLYQVSKDHGAMMTIHYSQDPPRFLARLLRDQQPAQVVTGLPHGGDSLLHRLWTRFQQIGFYTVDLEGNLAAVTLKDRVIA